MSNGDQFQTPLGPFSPAHQPDEGYSEDPLNQTGLQDKLTAAISTLRSPADLPAWLAANASLLPLSARASMSSFPSSSLRPQLLASELPWFGLFHGLFHGLCMASA